MEQYNKLLQNPGQMFEIFPTNKMTFERKVNAVIRLIVVLSVIGFLITRSTTFIIAGVVTIFAIIVLYYYQKNKEMATSKKEVEPNGPANVEGFETVPPSDTTRGQISQGDLTRGQITSQQEMDGVMNAQYVQTTKTNPLSNVLLTDYMDGPLRKPAPPAFNPVVGDDITSNVKKAVQSLNPNIENTNTQLFGGLYNKFDLDQSNRAFYSTAITTIPNDQGAYASFLYGTMPSGKLDAEQRVKDNPRYLLY